MKRAFHEWAESCETASDYTCAGFDGTPYRDVDNVPEEIVVLREAFYVQEADRGTDATAVVC
jgi:hypothetical protein